MLNSKENEVEKKDINKPSGKENSTVVNVMGVVQDIGDTYKLKGNGSASHDVKQSQREYQIIKVYPNARATAPKEAGQEVGD